MTEGTRLEDLSSSDRHPAEEDTEPFDREREIGVLEALRVELDEVQAALDRLEDGTYGRCETCGIPIGDERLGTLPATRYCSGHDR